MFGYAQGLATDIAPKMAYVLPLSGIAPAASVIQLSHKPMTSQITEFGGPARRAAVSCGRTIVDFGLGNQTQPFLSPSGFMGKTFRLGMTETGC